MARVFRPSTRESSILSKIESQKEHKRRQAISALHEVINPLSNAIAMKLVEDHLIETTNKNSLQDQINKCLDILTSADDFDVDYKVAQIRNLVPDPNIVSLYTTAFILENLINHRDVVDVFGSDEDIYHAVNAQVKKFINI